MESSRQALITDGELFSNIGIIFQINYIFKNTSDIGLMPARRRMHLF